jgi:hypothetical protein
MRSPGMHIDVDNVIIYLVVKLQAILAPLPFD